MENFIFCAVVLKSAKKNYVKLYTKEKTSKVKFLSKIPDNKEISIEEFNLCKEETCF